MDERSYSEFSKRIHSAAVRERIPVAAMLELTHRCPLACTHCFNNLPLSDPRPRSQELSTAEVCRILDELAELGTLWLTLTGGEVLARADFLDIYRHAAERGFLITLFTNATLVTPSIAEALARQRPFSIEVSLYGSSEDVFEKVTGGKGLFTRCLDGIRLLREHGLALNLKTVAVRDNRDDIDAIRRFAADDLGVSFRFDGIINPRIDGSAGPLAVRLEPAEVVRLDLADQKRTQEWQDLASRSLTLLPAVGSGNDLYSCFAGLTSLSIDPEGRMSLCVMSRRQVFDLRTGSVREGWEEFLKQERQRKAQTPGKCVSCGLKTGCGTCAAVADLENGNSQTPVDFMCRVAHLRAAALGWVVPHHGSCEYCPGGDRHSEIEEGRKSFAEDRMALPGLPQGPERELRATGG